MERKHWSHDHPAVMSWHGDREMARRRGEMLEPHVVRWYEERDSELSLAERRQAVVDRMPVRRRDTVKWQALVGLSAMLGSGFVFDHAQEVDGDWWLVCVLMLVGGGCLLVDAVRRSHGEGQ